MRSQIIESAMSSITSIRTLPPRVRDIVVRAYLDGLTCTYGKLSSTHSQHCDVADSAILRV